MPPCRSKKSGHTTGKTPFGVWHFARTGDRNRGIYYIKQGGPGKGRVRSPRGNGRSCQLDLHIFTSWRSLAWGWERERCGWCRLISIQLGLRGCRESWEGCMRCPPDGMICRSLGGMRLMAFTVQGACPCKWEKRVDTSLHIFLNGPVLRGMGCQRIVAAWGSPCVVPRRARLGESYSGPCRSRGAESVCGRDRANHRP